MPKASRVGETSTSTSSAVITLGSAITGLRTVASKHSVGETGIELVISDAVGNWLEGVYTFASSGPTVMTRTAILGSSNADGDVTFPAGLKTVQETASATYLNQLSGVRDISFTTALPFSFKGESYMPSYTMAGALAFTNAGGAVKGAYIIGQIVGDGTNTPTFASDIKDSGGGTTYDVRAGYPNTLYVWYDGFNVQRQYGQIVGAVPVPTPATALLMSGPNGGVVSVASTSFNVTANGTITGTVTWTPAESGTGTAGTFTPTSGATPGSFTYTPGSTGSKTISITNNGGLANPTPITYTVTAAATVPDAPTIGTATAGDTTMSQAGTAPSNNGGAAISSYQLKVYKTSDNTLVGTFSNATLPVSATGLTNGTAVYGKLAATNSVGTGAQSAASNSVTPVAAPTVVNLRLSQLTHVAETGSNPYTYTADSTLYAPGAPGPGGVATTHFASGVDGYAQFTCGARVGSSTSGSDPLFGVTPNSTITAFDAMAYGVYGDGGTSLYKAITGGSIGTVNGTATAPATGDILRATRTGSTLVFAVARAGTPTTFITLHTFTGVSTGVLYLDMFCANLLAISNPQGFGLV